MLITGTECSSWASIILNCIANVFTKSFQVHVERGRLTSFLKSAELLKVHGLCDQIDSAEQITSNVASNTEQPKKTIIKKSKRNSKPVTATISPAFAPLKNRNSPIPSTSSNQRISSSPGISVKIEEPNFSDEENCPEHVVIPTDPNSMGAGTNDSSSFRTLGYRS